MSKDNFNWYNHQYEKKRKPWRRSNDSRVAVNPERITTLLELAVEHYGKKCVRCGSKKRLTAHHRHYRTIGFEQPDKDIVLLCHDCHKDLHTRGSKKQLNRDDIPYVDPQWAEWLQSIEPRQQTSREDEPQRLWRALYVDKDGQEWVDGVIQDTYAAAEHEAQGAARLLDGAVELVEIVEIGWMTSIESMYYPIPLDSHQYYLDRHRGWDRYI